MALKPGSESSELRLIKIMAAAGILIAVLSSLGKVPFTPGQVGTYLTGVMGEAGEWSKILVPYVTAIVGFYAWLRSGLKKKELENETTP